MNKIVYLRHKPFDEVDATQQGTWIESYFANFINSINTSGIVSGLVTTFTSGMSVSISAGTAYDTNYALINVGNPVVKTLAVGDAANPRIDLISIKYATNTTNNTDTANKYGFGISYVYSQNTLDSFTITITQGTPAGSPTTPATPAGNLALASILVPANATVIIPGNITDLRVLIQLKQMVNASNIAPNTITDNMIGNRTVNDSVIAVTGAQTLVNNLSMLGNIIKQITGKAAWYTSPVTTIEAISTNLALKAPSSAPIFTNTVTINNDLIQQNLEVHRSSKDTNGKFLTVNYTRQDGTLFLNSVLSGTMDSLGNYPTRTETYYLVDGTTILKTVVYTRTFDVDGDLISEVY